MQWTRQQILTYLETYKSASAQELGGALNVTAANIRHHLHLLIEDGFVREVGKRPRKGPGRPQILYGLTPLAMGDNMQGLLRAILDFMQEPPGDEAVLEGMYQDIARGLIGDGTTAATNPIERYNQAVVRLNELQYHASWEAHPRGPRVILKHCPYQTLPRSYPGLCRIDVHLLSELTGSAMALSQRRSFTTSEKPHCTFSTLQYEG